MDILTFPAIFRYWWRLIVVVIALTALGLVLQYHAASAVYESRTRLLVTAPTLDAVSLLDNANQPTSSARDNAVLARNNLMLIVRSPDIAARTMQELNLAGQESGYTADVRALPDSDFIDVIVTTRSRDRAQEIASTHAALAIQTYGQLRAGPIGATKEFVAAQVVQAQQAVEQGATGRPVVKDDANPAASPAPVSPAALQARDTYQQLLKKQAELSLAEANALRTPNVQVAVWATTPISSVFTQGFMTFLALEALGSLALGLVLILLLESLFHIASGAAVRRLPPLPGRRELSPTAGPGLAAMAGANGAFAVPATAGRSPALGHDAGSAAPDTSRDRPG